MFTDEGVGLLFVDIDIIYIPFYAMRGKLSGLHEVHTAWLLKSNSELKTILA